MIVSIRPVLAALALAAAVCAPAVRAAASEARAAAPVPSVPVEAERLRRRLVSQGFEADAPFRQRGDTLLTEARRAGGRWKLVMDARSGEIVGVRLLGPVSGPGAD
jgi:hypothetical protein